MHFASLSHSTESTDLICYALVPPLYHCSGTEEPLLSWEGARTQALLSVPPINKKTAVVVGRRMPPIGSSICMLSHQLIDGFGKIRRCDLGVGVSLLEEVCCWA